MNEQERKPAGLAYGLYDKLPLAVAVPLVIQQIVVLSMDLVLPVLIVSMIGGSKEMARNFVSVMMIGIGVGTLLQVMKKSPVGSGYLCAEETGFLYFQASVLAAQTGGLSLLFGMTAVAGGFQMILSRVIQRIRFLFPTEVAGLMVAMTGIAGIPPGVSAMLGMGDMNAAMNITSAWIGLATLMLMVGMNVWGNSLIRQYSIFVGIVVGYGMSYAFGILTVQDLEQVGGVPVMALPSMSLGWSFDIRLVLPFFVAVLCSSLKTMGNLAICQKTNQAHWKRVDMKNVGDGIFAEGMGTVLCGGIGCMGLNSSSSSVGLSIATGVTSRYLAYLISGVFIILAFFPKAAALLAVMPAPVMGAVLLVNLGYFIIQGFQIITSRMLDDRKIFIVGLSMVFGLSVDMLPGLYAQMPLALQPLFKSSLTVVSLTAIGLNLLFRIGIKQKKSMELLLGAESTEQVIDFMEASGGEWGARREVVQRASSTIIEFMESAAEFALIDDGKMKLEISFDEYKLEMKVMYRGVLMEFPSKRPTEEELLNDDRALIRLSGFMMRRYANRVESQIVEKNCVLEFRFDD